MTIQLSCGPRAGSLAAPPSKSYMHRYAVLAALGDKPVKLKARGIPEDVWATAGALRVLGCDIASDEESLTVGPLPESYGDTEMPMIPVGESGTTLRFLLPLVGLLGLRCGVKRSGSLIKRPVKDLAEELSRHGMTVREAGEYLLLEGKLSAGTYELPGNVSSQYISSLLLTLPCLPEDSVLKVKGNLSSEAYLEMTLQTLWEAGIRIMEVERPEGIAFLIPGGQKPKLPAEIKPEGDWSGAAAFLAMGALSPEGISVSGLEPESLQADRAVLTVLAETGAVIRENDGTVTVKAPETPLKPFCFNGDGAPDLVPVLAALAAFAEGKSRISGTERLKLKESDRLAASVRLLRSAGIESVTENGVLTVSGGSPKDGGTVETFGDHRMAMAAAVLAAGLKKGESIALDNALCVGKSFPEFWRNDKGLRT